MYGCDIDIAFALDASSSVGNDSFLVQLTFVQNLLTRVHGKVRVSLLTFNDHSTVHFYLSDHHSIEDILHAISRVPYQPGGTNIAEALRTVHSKVFRIMRGDRPSISNFLVLLTDGVSNVEANFTIREAHLVHKAGINVYPIGIGLVEFTHELDDIATPPANVNRYVVRSFLELSSIEEKFVNQLCLGMLLTDRITNALLH